MDEKALKKQPNSEMCFVCGMQNPIGLKLFFYEDTEGRVLARFRPQQAHQGYPGILHGGIIATLLDEVTGRVASRLDLWMTTAKLEIRYRQPVPLDQELTVVGELVRLRGRLMEARGEVRLEDGSVAAEATGLYVQVPEDKAQSYRDAIRNWRVVPD